MKACYKVLAYGGTIDFHIPTSYESFTVSKENADRIHLVLVNMNMIPDISDTTGDGEAIHRDVVVEDIFDYEMNINTRINDRSGPTPNTNTRPDPKPQGDSTSKSQTEPEKATVKSNSKIKLKKKTAVYTGKNINIGKAKVEGSSGKVTYSYYKDSACKQKVKKHKNAGTYYVKAYVAADDKYQAAVSKRSSS